jgi:opacity protein-like surface antigen
MQAERILRMKTTRFFSFLALVLLLVPAARAAEFGVRAGRIHNSDQNFVGAEMLFDLGAVNVNPNFEYQLDTKDATVGTVNLDLTVDIGHFSRVTPYVGAGVGLLYADDDFGSAQTDALGNLIGGVNFDLDFLKPYAQVKYFRTFDDEGGPDDDDIAVVVGLRF